MISLDIFPISPTQLAACPSNYNEAVKAQFYAIPGIRWQKKHDAYVGDPVGIEAAIRICEEAAFARVASRKSSVDGRTYVVSAPHPHASLMFAFQRVGVDACRSLLDLHGAALLGDDRGLGKAQSIHTLTLTPNGWQRLCTLRPNDYVIGSNGKRTRVTGVFPQGVRPLYNVKFSDGSSVNADAEHLWQVEYYKGGKYKSPLILTTLELLSRPKIGKLSLSKTKLYLPLLSAPAQFAPVGLLIDPYVIGALIANGYLGGNSAVLTTNAHDWNHVKSRLDCDVGAVRHTQGCIHACIKGIMSAVRALGLNVKSAFKFIPNTYQRGTPEQRIALLQGLMDGDGSISKTRNKVTYHTTSLRLAYDVRELVEGLGGIASVRTYTREAEGKSTEYHVRMRLPTWVKPFSVTRKASRYIPQKNSAPCRMVKSVQRIAGGEAVCISVAAPDKLYVTEHCILTHNTAQAICVSDAYPGSHVVAAPAMVVPSWRREIAKWSAQPDSYYVYSYEEFQAASKLSEPKKRAGKRPLLPLPQASIIILDEAQYISESRSKRSQAIHAYCRGNPSMLRLALSGTPINSRVKNIWHLLDVLFPGVFGSFWNFTKRYCDGHYSSIKGRGGEEIQAWEAGGHSNLEELQARLAAFMVRRVKSEVEIELPPKTRSVIDVELPAAVRKSIKQAALAAGLASQLTDRAISVASLLSHVEEHKLDAACTLAADCIADGRRPLILSTRIASAETLARRLGIALAYGSTPPEERIAILSRASAACSTIDAVQVGITLVNFDVIIFVGFDWTPAKLLQAEDRIHRVGARNPCHIYYLCGVNSIDEIVRSRVIDRLDQFEKVLGSEDSNLRAALNSISDEEILQSYAKSLVA